VFHTEDVLIVCILWLCLTRVQVAAKRAQELAEGARERGGVFALDVELPDRRVHPAEEGQTRVCVDDGRGSFVASPDEALAPPHEPVLWYVLQNADITRGERGCPHRSRKKHQMFRALPQR
jgi:hypothetical protein